MPQVGEGTATLARIWKSAAFGAEVPIVPSAIRPSHVVEQLEIGIT